MILAALTCLVVTVTDADTIRCADGTRIRLAAISALERDGSCNSAPDCAVMPYDQAKHVVEGIALGRTYRFTIHGRSGKRLVGENRALRCAIVQSGAAVEWARYRVRYGLPACRKTEPPA